MSKKPDVTAPEASPEESEIETPELSEEEKAEAEKQERIEHYRKAGEIHKQVKDFIRPQVVVGAKVLDLCNAIEGKIVELGAGIGFPANVSINHHAAHYTSPPKDEKVIKDGNVVKIDIGVHIEGCVADSAFTVNFAENDPQLENIHVAPREAVMKAMELVKPGVNTSALSKVIEDTVKSFKYRPIKELTGHSILPWLVHGDKKVSNVATDHGDPIEEGDILAIEVFASTGEGTVHATPNAYIYSVDPTSGRVPLRSKTSRRILGIVSNEFKTLPFSRRWITDKIRSAAFGLRELTRVGKLEEYHVLSEKKGFYVGQFEHTVLVTADGYELLT